MKLIKKPSFYFLISIKTFIRFLVIMAVRIIKGIELFPFYRKSVSRTDWMPKKRSAILIIIK